jgi:hypothetical protein
MNRRRFGLSLGSTALSLSKHGAAQARVQHPIDDGQVELAVECVIRHTLGEADVNILFSLQSKAHSKEMLLSPGAAIAVNGTPLEVSYKNDGASYVATVPFTGKALNFDFRRSQAKHYAFVVVQPMFEVLNFPKTYRSPDKIHMSMATPYIEPGPTVLEDSYQMFINTANRQFVFKTVKLPGDKEPELGLSPIFDRESQVPGRFRGVLFRQHRIAMRDISSDFQRGSIVTSVRKPFEIDVTG